MNIGNVKGMLGDAVSNEVRTLELKIGQVVRGVVLQQYDNSEALVNINGVQVRAKLEIPLMEGQAALLQVQPDSKGSYILLKQVDPTTLGMGDPMKDILKAMSLPDRAWANEIIKDLRREGFPLNKETATAFQNAAQLIPSGVSQEAWMHAAATAFKRGLPITQATVSALFQLQNGSPIHSLMEQLKGQLTNLMQGSGSSQTLSSQTTALLNQLSSLLENGSTVMRSIVNNGSTAQAGTQAATTPGSLMQQPAAAQTQAGMQEQVASSPTAQQTATTSGANTSSQNNLAALLKMLGVSHEASLGKSLLQATSTQSVAQVQQQSVQQNIIRGNGAAQTQPPQPSNVTSAPAQSTIQPNVQPQAASVVTQPAAQQAPSQTNVMNQQVSAEVANTVQQPVSSTAAQSNIQQPLAGQQQPAPIAGQQVSQQATVQIPVVQDGILQGQQTPAHQALAAQQADNSLAQSQAAIAQVQTGHQADSLKSTIMQLIQSSDTPTAVKETAQQLLSAITGQQLMLSTERNHSVFSHVTMYIPLQDKNGSQTATVHIQTRRDRKGELDSDNCRLVFDLNMNAVGPMMVDVNIINKIVSLNLWNDHPYIGPIVEGLKSEITGALTQNGYMLSSLKTTPIPVATEENMPSSDAKKLQLPPDVDLINSTRYKGVDFKV